MTTLLDAMGIRAGDVVAVAGAGGKTTLVYRLADEAQEAGFTVLVTTTTHMGTLPEAATGPVLVEAEGGTLEGVAEALRKTRRATLLGRRVRADKLEGIAPERVDDLVRYADVVLVEADGARRRSLKVPAPHEPVVPARTTQLVIVAALDILGRPLTGDHVHRLERVVEATGRRVGDVVDESLIVAALVHPSGYPSRVPAGARSIVFLNKAEDHSALDAAERIAQRMVPPYHAVLAGSARSGDVRVLV